MTLTCSWVFSHGGVSTEYLFYRCLWRMSLMCLALPGAAAADKPSQGILMSRQLERWQPVTLKKHGAKIMDHIIFILMCTSLLCCCTLSSLWYVHIRISPRSLCVGQLPRVGLPLLPDKGLQLFVFAGLHGW